eukprot:jgi/Galph1/4054/GphlegSOOS_G2787.1
MLLLQSFQKTWKRWTILLPYFKKQPYNIIRNRGSLTVSLMALCASSVKTKETFRVTFSSFRKERSYDGFVFSSILLGLGISMCMRNGGVSECLGSHLTEQEEQQTDDKDNSEDGSSQLVKMSTEVANLSWANLGNEKAETSVALQRERVKETFGLTKAQMTILSEVMYSQVFRYVSLEDAKVAAPTRFAIVTSCSFLSVIIHLVWSPSCWHQLSYLIIPIGTNSFLDWFQCVGSFLIIFLITSVVCSSISTTISLWKHWYWLGKYSPISVEELLEQLESIERGNYIL